MVRIYALVILVLAGGGIFADILAPYSYDGTDLAHRLELPSRLHWLGTDQLGRDILSRLLYGSRISFSVAAFVVCVSLIAGTLLGSVAGYRGGWLEELLMRIADILLAFPGILLAIALMAVLGPDLKNVLLALIVFAWVPYARLARSLVLSIKEFDFVSAARSVGASSGWLLRRHVLPNVVPTLVVQASFNFAGAILAESSLSFLGLGVQPPYPSWGNMLSEGKNHLLDAPHLTLFPGLTIFLCVLSLNMLGDWLRDHLDPRWRP